EAAQRLYEFESTPEQEAERPEVVAYRTIGRHTKHQHPHYALNYYKQNAEDQAAHWRERGCEVSEDELMTVSQHERIVGALRAENAQLRQHKNDYMDAGQETYRALQNEIREREAEIARLDGLVSGRTAERDAALARVAELEAHCVRLGQGGAERYWENRWRDADARLQELEKQEPVATVAKVPGEDWNSLDFHRDLQDMQPGTKLYTAPVAQAQHSVPELLVRAEDFVSGKEVPQAWLDVQAERRRQVEAEGWTPEHDDLYCAAELPRAAAAYILNGANDEAPAIWPFSAKWWKPSTARRDMVKACALALAEIERLDRAAHGKEGNDD
ncbi:hypothetical protein QYP08_31250, partial [Pseudomonas aeruginosa]|nr:hypothetical protein [Pseudomonas aeruginosa]